MTRRRVRLRKAALADVDDLLVHLASAGPGLAERFAGALASAFQRLSVHPRIGHPVGTRIPALRGLRTWPVPGFGSILLLHRSAPDEVTVLRVVHGARDLGAFGEIPGGE